MSLPNDDDIDALLAQGMGRLSAADRNADSTPIGPPIVNWRELPDNDAAVAWARLRNWVEWFTVRYNIPVSTVPACWWRHGNLVEELSALHIAHQAAFDASDSGYGPIGWHERLSLALPRLTRAGTGCASGHHDTRPRQWDTATDENDWTAWITQTHAHPARPTRRT